MSEPVVISDNQGHERIKIGEVVETASISAGKTGSPQGQQAKVTADWWGLRVMDASGADVIEIGSTTAAGPPTTTSTLHPQTEHPSSTVAFGGGGFDGHLQMRSASGEAVIEGKLGATTGGPQGGMFQFHVTPVDLVVGTGLWPGTISAVGGATDPKDGVHIRSWTGEIDFVDGSKSRTRLEGHHGRLSLGGNGSDSDIYLYNQKGDNVTPAAATLHMSGADPSIGMLGANGKPTVSIDGQEAEFHLGGNGRGGAIVLHNTSGDNSANRSLATIVIDGQVGDITLQNADCAEEFDVAEDAVTAEPGTVMVIEDDGRLRPSGGAYDRRVAGVISGAGDSRPAITLGRDKTAASRLPVALVGRVFCKVDASETPIEVGDLLTTSARAGHAMKATDATQAFGSVLGKALAPLAAATGVIPILVALQ